MLAMTKYLSLSSSSSLSLSRLLNKKSCLSCHLQVLFLIILLLLSTITKCTDAQSEELIKMLEKMEEQTLEFAHKMEEIYSKYISTCDDTFVLEQCIQNNYAGCKSKLFNDQCLGRDDWSLPQLCTDSNDIGGIFSFDVSTVHIPDIYDYVDEYEDTDRDPRVTESMCYSLLAEQYMKDEYERHQDYWGQYNIAGPWYHFGSYSGLFRIYPGRPMKDCGKFPTLYRPWYVGASAGRKDVVILIDGSASLNHYARLSKVQNAVAQVINGLGYGDFVTVVSYNSNATILNDSKYLVPATLENKNKILKHVNNMEPIPSRTNYYDGFRVAFEILRNSYNYNNSSGCQTSAFLFLTDGVSTQVEGYKTNQEIFQLIESEKTKFREQSYEFPVFFTYSYGKDADHEIPKRLACENRGIWSHIPDYEKHYLAGSMGGYYKYFSYGLGDGWNHDFVAWSEPYLFATGDQLGTTVSAPVYDTTVTPNVLIGVVGLDIWLHVLEKAARDGKTNTENGSDTNAVLKELARRSVPFCPNHNLSESQLQGLRLAEGLEAVCENQAEPDKAFVRDVCDHFKEPLDVYANLDYEDLDHDERSCCCLDKSLTDCEFTILPSDSSIDDNSDGEDNKERRSVSPTKRVERILLGIIFFLAFVVAFLITISTRLCVMVVRQTKRVSPMPDRNNNDNHHHDQNHDNNIQPRNDNARRHI